MELKTTNKESGTKKSELGRINASASKGRPTQEVTALTAGLYASLTRRTGFSPARNILIPVGNPAS